MILKKSKFKKNGIIMVVRICDECGKEEEARLAVILNGREIRGKNIDLCGSCACSREYKKYERGEKHHSWKHGLANGYKRITTKDGRRMEEQRYVYEQFLNRILKKGETVHHIDFDKLNNIIDNLVLFNSQSEHRKCHMESIEKCGFYFLNKNIWFDFKNNKYVLEFDKTSCLREKIEVDLSVLGEKIGTIYPAYKTIQEDGSIKYRRCHTVVAEKIIGRKLYYGEIVHHIDGDYINNDPNNLIILSRKSHIDAHYSLQHCAAELYKMGLVGFDREKKEYYLIEK